MQAISAYKGFGVIMGLIQQFNKMLIFKMTSLSHFGNISVQISPNHKKMDILKSTRKGLLKKFKMKIVLLDTL